MSRHQADGLDKRAERFGHHQIGRVELIGKSRTDGRRFAPQSAKGLRWNLAGGGSQAYSRERHSQAFKARNERSFVDAPRLGTAKHELQLQAL